MLTSTWAEVLPERKVVKLSLTGKIRTPSQFFPDPTCCET